VAVLVSWVENA
jgi:hypothetical protein